jgi:hypothetical protein
VKAARCLTVAITICSWLAISNHCALQAFAAKTNSNQSACPFHSKPAKSKTNPTECCKILRAVSNMPAKTPAPAIVDLADVDPVYADFQLLIAPEIFSAPMARDTGPPGKTSFSELSRSMRAHAPPFLV